MPSISSIAILSICILYAAVRAYKKGLLRTLLGIFAVMLACVACYILGLPFGSFLESLGLNAIIAFPLSLLVIFFVVTTFFSNLLSLLFSQVSRKQKILAIPFGTVLGAFFGFLAIWAFNTVSNIVTFNNQTTTTAAENVEIRDHDVLLDKAYSLINTVIVNSGPRAQLTMAFVEKPVKTASAMKMLIQSKELKQFWNDEQTQLKMANNNAVGLMEEKLFQSLVSIPSVRTVIKDMASGNSVSIESSQRFFAEQLTYLWRRLRYIHNDERAQSILADPEFLNLVDAQNPIALLANTKTQALIKIVLKDENMDDFDFVGDLQYLSKPEPTDSEKSQEPERKAMDKET